VFTDGGKCVIGKIVMSLVNIVNWVEKRAQKRILTICDALKEENIWIYPEGEVSPEWFE
jgi:hypothetical protein